MPKRQASKIDPYGFFAFAIAAIDYADLSAPLVGTPINGKTHERKTTEFAGHVSQRGPQKQITGHHLPGQWRQASRQHHLVRQFLRAPAPGWSGPAGL